MRNRSQDIFRYLPVSEREKQWGLYVRAGGFESVRPGESYPHPGHPQEFAERLWNRGRVLQDYAALFITSGEGEFHSNSSGAKRLITGSVFLLFPSVRHAYRPLPDVGWDSYWMVFNGENVDRLVKSEFISPDNPVLFTGLDDVLLHGYVTLLDRLRAEPVGFEQLLAASAWKILAATLAAVRVQGKESHVHEVVCKAKTLLETQADTIPDIESLATSLKMSPTRFHRVFKEYTGLSPYQYYLQLRMERAKQMLNGTVMDIKAISTALVFESPFHFSRAFKRKTGMSPSQWRRQGHQTEQE